MSWDVILFKFKAPAPTTADDIDEASILPLGPAPTVRDIISATLPAVDWSNPAWGVYRGPDFSIEFNAGNQDPLRSLMLHVRGQGDVVPAIMAIATPSGWSALDSSSGDFLNPLSPSDEGWRAFQTYRDRATNNNLSA